MSEREIDHKALNEGASKWVDQTEARGGLGAFVGWVTSWQAWDKDAQALAHLVLRRGILHVLQYLDVLRAIEVTDCTWLPLYDLTTITAVSIAETDVIAPHSSSAIYYKADIPVYIELSFWSYLTAIHEQGVRW